MNDSGSNRNFMPRPDPLNGRKRRQRPFPGIQDSRTFTSHMKPPDYLINGVLQRGHVLTLTGNTGHGKSLLALLMAIQVARGAWFAGRECRQGKVVFFAAENPENINVQYHSLCSDLGVDKRTLDIDWVEGNFSLESARHQVRESLAAMPNLVLCIFDSMQALFGGDDDNANVPMLDFALDIRELTAKHSNRPTTVIIAHPAKNATRSSLLPRGGSSINNELDGNLTVWAEDRIVDLGTHGKFRGVPFDPIKFELVLIKPEGLVDARGDQMACTIVKPLGPIRAGEIAQQETDDKSKLLAAIADKEGLTQREIAERLGMSVATVNRRIRDLLGGKLVGSLDGRLVLTNAGKKALKMAQKQ